MSILSFQYEDLDSGWSLEKVSFDALNLLVGISGVGKSRLLDALESVQKAGLRGAEGVPSARWNIEIILGEESYRWQAETSVSRYERLKSLGTKGDNGGASEETDARFVSEKIWHGDELLVERNHRFLFEGHELPRLNEAESAIQLLAQEDAIEPLHTSLKQWKNLSDPLFGFASLARVTSAEVDRKKLGGDVDKLKALLHWSPLMKLYILQKDHRDLFDQIVWDFKEIFPTVQKVKIATFSELGAKPDLGHEYMSNNLAGGFQEEGAEGWILHRDWSTGMRKTLDFLIDTTLAPEGTVFLIDELENGLGVNCLPQVTRRMLEGLDRIQFIATSHHPRVINEIPVRRWKVVVRRGSRVRVIPAEEIEGLQRASALEKFTALINSPEYGEGIR